MPVYTVQITVEVWGESEQDAYRTIKHTLHRARRQEIVYVDAEVTHTQVDDTDEEEA